MDPLLPPAPIAPQVVTAADGRTEEVWPLQTGKDFLFALLEELFGNHWDELTFGPQIPGAAYAMKAPGKPERIGLSALGYMTVHWGSRGHIHLCLGAGPKMDPQEAKRRNTARAELVRTHDDDGHPFSWLLRLTNGAGMPQITIFFPNPFHRSADPDAVIPAWERLALWESYFPRLTGTPLDGRDRAGRGNVTH